MGRFADQRIAFRAVLSTSSIVAAATRPSSLVWPYRAVFGR
jgi:hypothetical protein